MDITVHVAVADFKELSFEQLERLVTEASAELRRRREERLLAGLVPGARVRTLRSGFGGGPRLLRYVVGRTTPGKDGFQAEFIMFAEAPTTDFNVRPSYLIQPHEALDAVELLP